MLSDQRSIDSDVEVMADAVESLAKRVTESGFEAKRKASEMGVAEDAKKWER